MIHHPPDTELKQRVAQFWEENPLFAGESDYTTDHPEFIEDHETLYREQIFAGQEISPEYFPFPNGGRILDVGCGPGFWTRQALRRGFDAVACDLTFSGLVIARNSLDVSGLEAELVQGDAEKLPFADEAFDGVMCHGVIHHTPNTQACIDEFMRVVKPGGRVILSVYYKNFILRHPLVLKFVAAILGRSVGLKGRGRETLLSEGRAEEVVRKYDGADNPLGKAFTKPECLEMVSRAGLRPEKTMRYFFPSRAFGRMAVVFRPFRKVLCNRFGFLIVVVARKDV